VFGVQEKHILITGGSSRLGGHFSRFLANNGAKVTLAARRAKARATAVAEIKADGGNAQGVQLDVIVAANINGAMK
jgi:NAD(P)-dependent dehydrogenase (short-subunit alcohol dehydrogenase family)